MRSPRAALWPSPVPALGAIVGIAEPELLVEFDPLYSLAVRPVAV